MLDDPKGVHLIEPYADRALLGVQLGRKVSDAPFDGGITVHDIEDATKPVVNAVMQICSARAGRVHELLHRSFRLQSIHRQLCHD
jgi:hypothetical protein